MYKLSYNLHRPSEHDEEDEDESSEEDWIKEWRKARASTPKKKNVNEVYGDESASERKKRQLLKSGPFKGTAGTAKAQQKAKKVVFERKSDEEFDKDEIEKAKRESILSLILV